MARKETNRRIEVPNNLWWYALIILLLSGVVGYFTYSKLVSLIPDIISSWQKGVILSWERSLPEITSRVLNASAAALGAGLTIYCFFFGLRCFIPPTVPTLTPKDYRNQPQVPEILRQGEIKTFFVPNSRLIKILERLLPSIKCLSKEPKLLIAANVNFLFKGGFIIGLLAMLYHFRFDILSSINGLGLNTTGIFVPSVIPFVWLIAAAIGIRLTAAVALMWTGKSPAVTLMSSSEYNFEGHPNIIYSAMQKAMEIIRRGEFPNRIHIDDSRLIPSKPPDTGVFGGMMLVESYPHYFSTAYVIAPAILLAAGTAFVAYGFKQYFSAVYDISPMSSVLFLKSEMPLYIRDLLVFICYLFVGKTLLLQALKLISHYRFRSNAVLVDFSGSYVRSNASPQAAGAEFSCRAEAIFRSAEAFSEAYQLWGQRELLSFTPSKETPKILNDIVSGIKEELSKSGA